MKLNKEELAQKINALEGLDNETKSQLLELLHERKRYGLVWENHKEDVEERLRSELPVLREVKDRAIISDNPDSPNHILIEGDNLEALVALRYTHKNNIDVIYIDPPYNTGNKDFIYNDKFVDIEDEYRHSKWLSFMEKRLKIAKQLLSANGTIFISIDDNEQANLKLLCDEILGDGNFVTILHVEMSATQGMKVKAAKNGNIVKNGEYIIIYKMGGSKNVWTRPLLDPVKYDNHYNSVLIPENDYFGEYPLTRIIENQKNVMEELKLLDILESNGKLANKQITIAYERSPKFRQWVNTNADKICRAHDSIDVDESFKKRMIEGKIYLYRNDDREYYITRTAKNEIFQRILFQDKLSYADDFYSTYGPTKIRGDWWAGFYLDMGNVSKEGGVDYKNGKKPLRLIQQLIQFSSSHSSTILDFFAGSGTTLHATIKANSVDNGTRKCILVQCPEENDNICKSTTLKRAINVYKEFSKNSIRYYKTDFVARESSLTAKKELMTSCTDLLCIKEDIYTEQPKFGSLTLRPTVARYFADGDRQMLIIYNPEAIERIVEEIATMEIKEPIAIYIFSLNDYAYDADFVDVDTKVRLCALPAAIYRAYLKVLPKKQTTPSEETPINELNFEED